MAKKTATSTVKQSAPMALKFPKRAKKLTLMAESSSAARAADIEQSDREYLASKRNEEKFTQPNDAVTVVSTPEENAGEHKNSVDFATNETVQSFFNGVSDADVLNNTDVSKEKTMNLTLKGLDKRGRYGIYTGAAVNLRVPIAAFPNRTAPPSFSVEGLSEKVAKPKLTPEERKAARAAKPKLTLAEKVQKAEERAAKLRAALATAADAPAGDQPSA